MPEPPPSPSSPPPALAAQAAAVLDRLTRDRFGLRVATALVLGWAWVTVVGLTAGLAREAAESARFNSLTAGYPGGPDPAAIARAVGGLVVAGFVIPGWAVLFRLTRRTIGVLHYLATNRFEFFATGRLDKSPGDSIDPKSLPPHVSYLLEHAVSWFRWYLLGWVALQAVNAVVAVFVAAVVPEVWPRPVPAY